LSNCRGNTAPRILTILGDNPFHASIDAAAWVQWAESPDDGTYTRVLKNIAAGRDPVLRGFSKCSSAACGGLRFPKRRTPWLTARCLRFDALLYRQTAPSVKCKPAGGHIAAREDQTITLLLF
jgi:hypothetical protein